MEGRGSSSAVIGEYSVSALWNQLASRLPVELGIVAVNGLFAGFSNNKLYNGFYYGKLGDVDDGRLKITLKVPERLRDWFEEMEGQPIKVVGAVMWKSTFQGGAVELVVEVVEVDTAQIPEFDAKIESATGVIAKKMLKGFANVESLLLEKLRNGKKPKIKVFVGEGAIVDRDIEEGLGEAKEFYEIEFVRVNLKGAQRLKEELLKETDSDLLVIARGGGSGLEVFDDLELATVCLNLSTPLAVAIGHAEDSCLLDRIADRSFITPTEFGKFLAQLSETTLRIRELEKMMEKREQELGSRIKELEDKIRKKEEEGAEKEKHIRDLTEGKAQAEGRNKELESRLKEALGKVSSLEEENKLHAQEKDELLSKIPRLEEELKSYRRNEKIYWLIIAALVGAVVWALVI